MSDYSVDTGGLEAALFKENDLLLLGVNGGAEYVPLRVMARIERPYLYDTVKEGLLPAGLAASPSVDGITQTTYQTALQLGSKNLPSTPTDVFDISNFADLMYQMFVGIDPPATRVFVQQPFGADQGSFPVISFRPAYAQEGWWDGFMSPVRKPNPKTQTIILPKLSIGLGFQNVEPLAEYPTLLFWVNACKVNVVTDAQLAYEMITTPDVARIATVGGLQRQNFSIPDVYRIPGVRLDMTQQEIAAGVSPG